MGDGHADAEARLGRLLDAQAVLGRAAGQLGPDLSLPEVLSIVLEAMRKLVDFRGGSVQLLDERGVYIAAADPMVTPDVAALRLRVGEGMSGRVVATGVAIRSDDLDLDPRAGLTARHLGSNATIRSYLAVPLVCLGDITGVLQIDAETPDALTDDDTALLEGLASQVAGVIESAHRYELVMELERLKGDFLSRVSHELRTPITIIDGFVQTMLEHGAPLTDADRATMLERCHVASKRLGGLIEELITLSRLQTGLISAHLTPTTLGPLVASVAAAAVDPEKVELVVDDEGDVTVLVDGELLRRALGLLVDNAIKYGGRATIVVTAHGSVVEVRDDGPGIPDDVRRSVFELFTRGRATTDVPGLGLGLPMARTLLAVGGAPLTLVDRPGGGTTLRITLS